MKLLVATRNPGKLEEIRALFRLPGLDILGAADVPGLPEVVEDGATFEANAVKKAVTLAIASGGWALADDSGLEVDALDGGPGVRTRRFASETATDEENNAKLLDVLRDLPPPERGARYVCVLSLVLPDDVGPRGGLPIAAETRGTCRGRIAAGPTGEGGFGYDPIFEPAAEAPGGRTLGLYRPDEKHAISHRARAARAMAPRLERLGF